MENIESNYDAIVIGTGVSGGWAAKELTEKGLKTLVLDRGRLVKHIEDYSTMNMDEWDFPAGDVKTAEIRKRQPVQTRTGQVKEHSKHFFVVLSIITFDTPELTTFFFMYSLILKSSIK